MSSVWMPPVDIPEIQQLDLGEIMRQNQESQNGRTRNQLMQQELQLRQQEQNRQAQLAEALRNGGDISQIDPELALKLQEHQLRAQSTQIDLNDQKQKILANTAKYAATLYDSLPDNQRNQQTFAQIANTARAELARQHPELGQDPIPPDLTPDKMYAIASLAGYVPRAVREAEEARARDSKMQDIQAQEGVRFGYDQQRYGMQHNNRMAEIQAQAQGRAAPVSPYERERQKLQAQQEFDNQGNAANAGMLSKIINDPRIDQLVSQSTASGLGRMRDSAMRAIGETSQGAAAVAELEPIAARLVMLMPRGPGAQSDRDVQLAKEMAGDFANPAKTTQEKLQSLRGLRELLPTIMQRYGGQMPQGTSQGMPAVEPQAATTQKSQPGGDWIPVTDRPGYAYNPITREIRYPDGTIKRRQQ